MTIQTTPFNRQPNAADAGGRFHLSHGALWQLMQHMVQVASKSSMPLRMHFGLGNAQTISALLPLFNSGSIAATVHLSENMPLNNGRLHSALTLQTLPANHPFANAIFALAATESWQILFWATPEKGGFEATMTCSPIMFQRFANAVSVHYAVPCPATSEAHSLTANLLWRLNEMFDRPELVASGLHELAQPFRFAHTLRIQSGDKRWQQAVWTIQDILKSKKASIYRLDEMQNGLVPLASDGFVISISLYEDLLLTRAIVINQFISGVEGDATVLAMSVAEGDIVWGGIELHFYESLSAERLDQAILYGKIIEQALLDYGMPQESPLTMVEQINTPSESLASSSPAAESSAAELDEQELAELMALLGRETAVSPEPDAAWNQETITTSGEEPFLTAVNADVEAFLAQQPAEQTAPTISPPPAEPNSELPSGLEQELLQFMQQNGLSVPNMQDGMLDAESRLDLEMQIQELTTRQDYQQDGDMGGELPADLEAELAAFMAAATSESVEEPAVEPPPALAQADDLAFVEDDVSLPADIEAELAAYMGQVVDDDAQPPPVATEAADPMLTTELEDELAALLTAAPAAEHATTAEPSFELNEEVKLDDDIEAELALLMSTETAVPTAESTAEPAGSEDDATMIDAAHMAQESELEAELEAVKTAVSELEARVAAQRLVHEDSEALLHQVREERLALEANLLEERAAKEEAEKWYYSEQSAREELAQGVEIFRQEQADLEEKLEAERVQQEALEQSLATEQASRRQLEEALAAAEAQKEEIAEQLTAVQEEAAQAEAEKAEAEKRMIEAKAKQADANAKTAEALAATNSLTETKLVQELVAERAQTQKLARLDEDLRLIIILLRARFLRLVPQSLLNSIQGQMFKQLVSEADTAIEILQDVQMATDRQGRKQANLNWLALVEEVLSGVQPQLQRYGLRVVETSPRFAVSIAGDRDRLTHMLYNFFRGVMMLSQPSSEWWLTMEEVGETAVFKLKTALAPQHAGLTNHFLTHFQNGVPQRNHLANAHTLAVQNGGLLTIDPEENNLFAFTLTFPLVLEREDVS